MTTEDRIAAMLKTAAILRTLEAVDKTMTYGVYSIAVGIRKSNESWHIKHRRLVSQVLDATAAIANQAGEVLNFHRIVNTHTGEAGVGADRHRSVVVREDA
jgi:hypothetical protein